MRKRTFTQQSRIPDADALHQKTSDSTPKCAFFLRKFGRFSNLKSFVGLLEVQNKDIIGKKFFGYWKKKTAADLRAH
jgi:hypothetical protein